MASCTFYVIFTLFLLLGVNGVREKNYNIGAIFDESNYDSQMAFKYAIDRINMHSPKIKFTPIIKIVPETDSFTTGKEACELIATGVVAIFGPESVDSRGIVQSICETFEIPHVETLWLPDAPDNTIKREMSINFHPEEKELSRAYAELVNDYDWLSYTILYEEDEGLIRLQAILKRHGPDHHPITLRQLDPGGDNRQIFKSVKNSGETHIIIDCKPENVLQYLRQANEVKLMGDYQSYILTNLDTHIIDLAEFKFGRTNVTCVRMVDPSNSEVLNAVHDWEEGERLKPWNQQMHVRASSVKLKAALMNDAVKHFAWSIIGLSETDKIIPTPMMCDQKNSWKHGLGVANFMKMKRTTGMTGDINFTENKRTEFNLDIMELSKEGFKKIGIWSATGGIVTTRTAGEVIDIVTEKWQNKVFIVSSRIGAPFLMHKEPQNGEVLTGNARYEGYSMDLLQGISEVLNISYEFKLAPDGQYGSYDKNTKKWNGLIKELLEGRADLAICDLTITSERKSAVDFTMPFMTLGISILYSKPAKQPPDLFSFLSPLSLDVWIYMGTAYLGVSLLLFILARMSPTSWENPRPGYKNDEDLVNIWELRNTFWFSMGSLMGAGCDILPKAVSTRMVAGMWWFFTLIMISSYTANLAAFLTNERMDATIESAEDLAKQTKIKYGTVNGGSTSNFFKNSNFSTYKRMWAAMESTRPSVFVTSNSDGVERVSKGKRLYAFLMESTSIEYVMERNCDLTQIGGQLDSKGYGIAMPPNNSPYRTKISGAVLRMQEEGKLHVLKTKWWKEMHGGGVCKDDVSAADDSAAELGLDNVGGVFVVLGCGCGIAFVIAILEFLWNVRQVAVEEKITFRDALVAELKFAMNIWETTKPVHNTLSESQSSSHSSRSNSKERESVENKMGSVFTRLDKLF